MDRDISSHDRNAASLDRDTASHDRDVELDNPVLQPSTFTYFSKNLNYHAALCVPIISCDQIALLTSEGTSRV